MKKNIQKSPLHAFSAWNQDDVVRSLGLKRLRTSDLLQEWLQVESSPSKVEKERILFLREYLIGNWSGILS